MVRFRRCLGWLMVGASLLLHLLTVYAFAWQPDRLAAFTVLPIWLWGGCGLILATSAGYFVRSRASWLMSGIWALTLLVGAEEARVLTHWGYEAPRPGRPAEHDGRPVLRVITLNCAVFAAGNPIPDLVAWQPDIVLLQDARPHQVQLLARALYGSRGDHRAHISNGIATRWKIRSQSHLPGLRNLQATVVLPDGLALEVVNVHLATAATDLRFWQRTTWRAHRINRALRLAELAIVQQKLMDSADHPETASLFGGDFNAPATDVVYRRLRDHLQDAFATAGSGWGGTYHRRFPVLRIDHLYVSAHLTPVRCHTVVTRHSDHRMVVADFVRTR